MTSATVTMDSVDVVLNKRQILHSVDLSMRPGEVWGLLGPNGAGKTTCLRALLGLIRPTRGSVTVHGSPNGAHAKPLSSVGALIEGPGLVEHLTGRDNLRFNWLAGGSRWPAPGLTEAEALANLGHNLDERVKTYSQGMRQRLAIARTLLGSPTLLVLDEPTNGLDPIEIRRIRSAVQAWGQQGRSVIVSSHLLTEIEHSCTHLAVIAAGRIRRCGPVEQVIGHSQNLESAFIQAIEGASDG